MKSITINWKSVINKALAYSEFIDLIHQLFDAGKVTGNEQSANRLEATKINLQRIKRLNKTAIVNSSLSSKLASLKSQQVWILFVEGWCGDVAQNVPVIEKIALASNGLIQTKYLLRDENLELFDHFLTNGTRSIPKLIAISGEENDIIFEWGPRPKLIQDWYKNLLSTITESEKEEAKLKLHQYYTENKGAALQDEFLQLLNDI
jgi:thioredoxin-like negative regulator of GroEL